LTFLKEIKQTDPVTGVKLNFKTHLPNMFMIFEPFRARFYDKIKTVKNSEFPAGFKSVERIIKCTKKTKE
jgi:hypothetical protein